MEKRCDIRYFYNIIKYLGDILLNNNNFVKDNNDVIFIKLEDYFERW